MHFIRVNSCRQVCCASLATVHAFTNFQVGKYLGDGSKLVKLQVYVIYHRHHLLISQLTITSNEAERATLAETQLTARVTLLEGVVSDLQARLQQQAAMLNDTNSDEMSALCQEISALQQRQVRATYVNTSVHSKGSDIVNVYFEVVPMFQHAYHFSTLFSMKNDTSRALHHKILTAVSAFVLLIFQPITNRLNR